jgi:hypothetical protein
MIMGIATDIARTARTCAHIMQSVFHRINDVGMLPHAQIVVRAPYGDILGTIMTRKTARARVIALVPQYIDKYAIAAFGVKPVDRLFENSVIVHER